MKKLSLLLLIIVVLSSIVFAKGNLVSVEDNGIRIESMEYANCKGTICTYEFTIENKGLKDKSIEISNLFSDDIEIISIERLEDVEKEIRVLDKKIRDENNTIMKFNEELVNNSNLEIINGTIIGLEPKNINYSLKKEVFKDWNKISKDNFRKSKKAFTEIKLEINKNNIEKYRVQVFQPIGKKTKFDIITNNGDGSETILDPWIDNSHYYINISNSFDYGTGVDFSDSDLYFLLLKANNISSTNDFQTLNNKAVKVDEGKWLIYNNASTYEINKAKLMSMMFYDTFARANGTFIDNPTLLGVKENDDFEKKAYYIYWMKTLHESTTHYYLTLSFFDTENNTNVNYWSYVCSRGWARDVYDFTASTTQFESPSNSVINQYYQDRGNSWDCSNEINIDTSSDDKTNPSNFRFESWGSDSVDWSGGYVKLLVLFKGNISKSKSPDNGYNVIYNEVDYQYDKNFPVFSNAMDDFGVYIIRSDSIDENLSIDDQYEGAYVYYDENVVLEINDTSLGDNLQSGRCYGISQDSLNWTIKANVSFFKDNRKLVNYTFVSHCSAKYENEVRDDIVSGIMSSNIANNNEIYYDKIIHTKLSNGSQYSGRSDLFVISGNKRWVFNYDQNSSLNLPIFHNITPIFYVWKGYNLSVFDDTVESVKNFIDNTN